jgi:hypothetical protein
MLFTTFLPTKRNDRSKVSRHEMVAIHNEAVERFGGFTLGPKQEGAWLDPATGKTYFDRTKPLTINCDRSQLEEARQWVLEIGRRLDQEAMYFEVRGYDGVQILTVA